MKTEERRSGMGTTKATKRARLYWLRSCGFKYQCFTLLCCVSWGTLPKPPSVPLLSAGSDVWRWCLVSPHLTTLFKDMMQVKSKFIAEVRFSWRSGIRSKHLPAPWEFTCRMHLLVISLHSQYLHYSHYLHLLFDMKNKKKFSSFRYCCFEIDFLWTSGISALN